MCMCGVDLGVDVCLVFGYDWEEEFDCVDVFFEQVFGEFLCEWCVVQYYWVDWMYVWFYVEIGGCYFLVEVGGVVGQCVVQVVGGGQYFEGFDVGSYYVWWQGVGEQIGV